jgi:hypothetical protein
MTEAEHYESRWAFMIKSLQKELGKMMYNE